MHINQRSKRQKVSLFQLFMLKQAFGIDQRVDGKKFRTLRGPTIAADFKALVIDYIDQRYGKGGQAARNDGGGVIFAARTRRSDISLDLDDFAARRSGSIVFHRHKSGCLQNGGR
jgi:hypothetical protein